MWKGENSLNTYLTQTTLFLDRMSLIKYTWYGKRGHITLHHSETNIVFRSPRASFRENVQRTNNKLYYYMTYIFCFSIKMVLARIDILALHAVTLLLPKPVSDHLKLLFFAREVTLTLKLLAIVFVLVLSARIRPRSSEPPSVNTRSSQPPPGFSCTSVCGITVRRHEAAKKLTETYISAVIN